MLDMYIGTNCRIKNIDKLTHNMYMKNQYYCSLYNRRRKKKCLTVNIKLDTIISIWTCYKKNYLKKL